MAFNSSVIRADFPFLDQRDDNGMPPCFLDSAASAQKPRQVLEKIDDLYRNSYANIHRGLYRQSADLTALYEAVRIAVDDFIAAYGPDSVVFTKNTTEAINMIAASWGQTAIAAGDDIVLTMHEHHANIVPWQILAGRQNAEIKVLGLNPDLTLNLAQLPALLSAKTKLVAVAHVSNALGIINPVAEIVKIVRKHAPQAKILIDGSQAVVHQPVSVRDLDADFYVFTGHKLYAPVGAGVAVIRPSILANMPPYQGGGDMIDRVSFSGTTFKSGPARLEAGTPDFMAVIGLGEAIAYLQTIGMDRIAAYETELRAAADNALATVPGLTLWGADAPRIGIFSLSLAHCHPADTAMILDAQGIAVRNGHHCCQPLMEDLGVTGTVRASGAIYTSMDDIDRLVAGLQKATVMLTRSGRKAATS
ncbi:MAG: SufS family cysteine desulfurase [Pseudomonadota bacterium]